MVNKYTTERLYWMIKAEIFFYRMIKMIISIQNASAFCHVSIPATHYVNIYVYYYFILYLFKFSFNL